MELLDYSIGDKKYFNSGREYERERIIKLLEQHKQTTKSVSGFLGVCYCGEAVDDYSEHLQEVIKGEPNG